MRVDFSSRPRHGDGGFSGPVAILGAGPYGLAAAAHLRAAGAQTLSFGEPLEFWRNNMPTGMVLRSRYRSSSISDPKRQFTISDYERAVGTTVQRPHLRLEEFLEYASWFQRQAVPEIDSRRVASVRRENGSFELELSDGERVEASRVVIAGGLSPFPRRPEPFASLPPALVSHAADHVDLGVFAGKRVIVIGAGQSALESAALLSERGASVELLARAPMIRWLAQEDGALAEGPPRGRFIPIAPPPTDVGGRLSGWIAATPDVYRRTPPAAQAWVVSRCIRPAGAAWLKPRLENAVLSPGHSVVGAEPDGEQVRLVLADGSQRLVDHVLLGTGYQVDVRRYPFLAPELTAELELVNGYPRLTPGLESSVPGLHFVGAAAAYSFGPIMRFVVGTWYAAPAVTRGVLGHSQKPISFAF